MPNASQLFKDDEDEKSYGRPSDDELRHITGIGKDEEAAMEQGARSGASREALSEQESNPGSPASGDSSAIQPGALGAAEGAAASEFAFNPLDRSHRSNIRLVLRSAGNHKKGLLVGGGGLAGIGAFIAILFFMLIPLKIENIVTNLQNKFFATSENAVDNETENLFSAYVKKSVLPALTKCSGTTVTKNCNPVFGNSTNPVDALFRGWQNAKLEDKLAKDYNIEFKYDKAANKYYMKAPGLPSNGEDITKFASPSDAADLFQEADRGQIRQTVREALQNETKTKQVLYRYKIGRLLEEKYGIRRCLMFCGTTDALQDFAAEKSNAAQIYLVQRVITPRLNNLGIVMECILSPTCDPEKTEPTAAEPGSSGELAGAPENPETDTAVRTNLEQLAGKYGVTDAETVQSMIDDYNKISEKGYSGYALNKLLEKVGLEDFSSQVSDSAPVIGWVNFGANVITGLHKLGPSLKKLTYITNATAAVSLFEMYSSYSSEIHTGSSPGKLDATEVGSMVDSLSPGDHGAKTDSEVGGTAGAEGSPLYASLIGGSSNGSTSSDYKCQNGSTPKAGTVCSEEKLGVGDTGAASSISHFFSLPGVNIISSVASAISSVTGAISSVFGSIISHIPGVGSLSNLVGSAISPVFSFLSSQLIPDPFGSNMSGGRTFDMMAAGADVAGNDYAHTGLGGQELTTQQASAIQNQQEQEAKQQFSSESFFARMFSTSSPYSLVSKMAVALPVTSASTAAASFGSILSNPFGTIGHNFSSIFTPQSSADPDATDAFGVTQYGFTSLPSDQESYWTQNCSDNAAQAYQNDANFQNPATNWNDLAANGTPDANTGMPVNTTPNYCMLIKASVGAAGGAFDTSLLTQDDLADINNGAGAGTTSTAGATIDMSALDQDSTGVACAAGTNDIGNYTGYYQGQAVPIKLCAIPNLPSSGAESNGQYGVSGANGDAVVNSRVSGAVLAMVTAADASGLKLTANSTYRSMVHQEALCPCDGVTVAKPGYSNHQMGLAIDFSNLPGTPGPVANNPVWTWLNENASKYGYSNYPREAWHWSPTGN